MFARHSYLNPMGCISPIEESGCRAVMASGTACSVLPALDATGVFNAVLETLAEVIERDGSADMIGSTVVRAHHCAVRIKR